MPRNSLFWSSVLLIALLSFGCKKKEAPPAPVQPQPAKPADVQQPVKPVQKQPSSVKLPPPQSSQFDFSKKKDPFKPYVEPKLQLSQKEIEANTKKQKEVLPIHQYDVNQFRLIGIVSGVKENRAMIVDPAGKGYVVRLGMTVGKNDGKLTALMPTYIEVTEQFKDDNGKIHKEVIRLTIPKKI